MVIEIRPLFFSFSSLSRQRLSPSVGCETINHGATEVFASQIVDGGTAVGSRCGSENNKPDIEVAPCGMIGRRGYHEPPMARGALCSP